MYLSTGGTEDNNNFLIGHWECYMRGETLLEVGEKRGARRVCGL